jgi:primary-amine oxidase
VWVSGANHQHFCNYRLDLDVDGPDNHVMEMEVAHMLTAGFKNAVGATSEHVEPGGFRDGNPLSQRHWHVASSSAKNTLGSPTAYALEPGCTARARRACPCIQRPRKT